ncbi:MAG: ClpXP protease specificity-enhancing factor [Alteromonadaceae bacterium]|uniref:ClpXP protease specificity-enhancing factor n=1 Tax=unclassified Marinobacter TaxID=83889 RepID=UPI000C61D618|nr:ClpXP protease specificity-enhancing factor [Marinobacter sp. BGYM27]MAA66726.1 ClpXP protease specificity-enhancing factor [Alteromonadaceae bacterium]MBH84705.1 ClpXP protease specificity-enhancing factor [Alteromonadaceae bacterium]MDG5498096.1 ClpXP protease specificity-enhancing factor [Marinobacter sp. BGYM27]|tara:strand:+ start:259 stop:687 length:429 start_codon:yes stop_codon:yes gene_type:complete
MSEKTDNMLSSRPYLVRAFNEWILDNNCTPYILVDAGIQGVQVPAEHVANGQIVLNISPSAVKALMIGNGALEFSARFGGVPMQVSVPLVAVLAIYAKENGEGMVFGTEPGSPDPEGPSGGNNDEGGKPERPSGKPSLKVVK